MALIPYTATALAESDAEGTSGKNIVEFATVTLFDLDNNPVTMYDDINGANGQTTKLTNNSGYVIFWVNEGTYKLIVNATQAIIEISETSTKYGIGVNTGVAWPNGSDLTNFTGVFPWVNYTLNLSLPYVGVGLPPDLDGSDIDASLYYSGNLSGFGSMILSDAESGDLWVKTFNNGITQVDWQRFGAGGKIATPMDYGAVGDGLTDDTFAVQECLDNEDYTLIDKVYAVTSVAADNFMHCINEGELKSLGPTNARVLTITAENVGDIVVNGNGQAVNCIYFPEGANKKQRYNSIKYSNVTMNNDALAICTGVTMFSEEVSGGPIVGSNMDNNGYVNDSFPQGFATGGGIYHIERHFLKDGTSGIAPTGTKAGETVQTASGKLFIGENHTLNCADNSAYLLGGYVNIGTNIAEGVEESVQINAVRGADIGRIIAIGRTLGAFNLQNTLGPVNIGEIVGAPEVGVDFADYPEKTPTSIGYVRSGNLTLGSNEITIGSVKGYFQLGFALGGVGTGERITVTDVDVTLCYKPSASPLNQWDANPSLNRWYSFEMFKEVTLRNHRVTVKNFEAATFPTSSPFAAEFRSTGVNSIIENLDVTFVESDNTIADPTVQFVSTASTDGIKVLGGYWANVGANTRNIRPENASYLRNSISNGPPLSGYWLAGDVLLERTSGKGGEIIHRCNVAGSPGTWTTIGGVITGTGVPVNVVTPDYVGQYWYSTDRVTLWASYGESIGEWLPVSNRPLQATSDPSPTTSFDYIGQFRVNTASGDAWIAYGVGSGEFTKISTQQSITIFNGNISSTGSANSLPSGWTSSRTSAGRYLINHTLATNAYDVVANGTTSSLPRMCQIDSASSASFEVFLYDNNGLLSDGDFNFILSVR